MKSASFHYKICFNGDAFNVRYDSAKFRVNGFSTMQAAIETGKKKMEKFKLNPLTYSVIGYDPLATAVKLTGFEARKKAIDLNDLRTKLDEVAVQYGRSFGSDMTSKKLYEAMAEMHSKELALKELYEQND